MSIETLGQIKAAVERRPRELAKARRDGAKVVGYFCCNIPEEILLALDLIPIRLGSGGDDHLVELGGRYISTQNCVFVRQSVGLFAEGKDPYVTNSDLVAVAGTCIQIYRLGEVVEHFFDVPVQVLGVPRNFVLPEGKEYFRRELENFTASLEEFAGRKLSVERLRESIALLDAIRGAVRRLNAIQARSDVISWRQVFEVTQAAFFLDRGKYLALLESLLDELESARLRGKQSVDGEHRPRIFVSGSIIPVGDTKLIDVVEEVGGRIVGDDLCTGARPFKGLAVKEPTVAGVADAYLSRVPCASLPNLSLDGDRRIENLLESIRDSGAQGVVYHSLRYCDPFTFKAPETKRVLGPDIPFVEIHTEYATSDVEGIRTRLEAFIEVLRGQRVSKEVANVR